MRIVLFLTLFAAVFVSGCNAVSDMKDMFAKQALVSKAIKDQTGLDSQIGWNMQNGVLTQVTVAFDAEQVREKTVAFLESTAQEAVAASFKSTPQRLNVQVVCKAKS